MNYNFNNKRTESEKAANELKQEKDAQNIKGASDDKAKGNKIEKPAGYRLIKRRRDPVVMPEAKYDGAFDKENPYYIKIANKYRIMKYVTILLAVVFGLSMLTTYSTDITAENFQYLIKDLDITGLTGDRNFGDIIYNGDSSSWFGIYRGELIVVNSGSTMLYKPSGALSFEDANDFYNPRLSVSDKYFMVYDRGDTSYSYSVYNSFAELKNESFEFPITLAAISDEGSYAVVTRDDSYRSIVYYYDNDFKPLNQIKKDKYVTALAFTNDGSKLAIASVYDKDGDFVAEIQVIKGRSETAEFTITEDGLLPVNAKWLSNGNLCVLYSDCVVLYSSDGERISSIDCSSCQSLRFSLGEELLVAVYNSTVLGYDKTVDIYDENADIKYTFECQGDVISVKAHDKYICILFEDRVLRIDPIKGVIEVADVLPNAKDIVFYGDTVMICYAGVASPAVFNTQTVE